MRISDWSSDVCSSDLDETAAMRREFEQGIGWGDAKQRLFERIDSEVAPLRERYETLMAEPPKIERLLRDGARRLRAPHATPLLRELRAARSEERRGGKECVGTCRSRGAQ